MPKIIIANTFSPEILSDFDTCTDEDFLASGHYAQGLLWSAEEDDVLVLPTAPGPDFARYAARLMGLDPSRVHVTVPERGLMPEGLLSPDTLLDPPFTARLARLAGPAAHVWPYYYDRMSAEATHALGLTRSTPGFGYVDEGGARLLNSKANFRAIAAGNGLPVPPGIATADRTTAVDYARQALASHGAVMVKQDYNAGGFGNEIITLDHQRRTGTRNATVLAHHDDVHGHFDAQWDTYTNGGRDRVVIELYIEDCVPVYREMHLTPAGVEAFGHGEMLMNPAYDGLALPGRAGDRSRNPDFFDGAERIAEVVHAMGYRGLMSVDALLTPSGGVLFNEFNCRNGGSTHIHRIGQRVIGGDPLADRTVLVRRIPAPLPFAELVERLEEQGLAFDPGRRTGVVLATDVAPDGKVQYCAVARTAEEADALERLLPAAFGHGRKAA
ncbi:hypothetical protein EF910_00165 [Streptomyces sp. WAC07149]|uniref:preATP grasp domain-containing protein n=1 Tax=Streptomyces sp. WAC07149 TaxID=2487425 RepID=UPI000F78DF68|nr:peptide ligase PGM1-related protein [Streptomyces sp. WAC07149]RST08704.1 hypothetical protein EF910_00165 [Streptomyces sp. WAC07149]